MNTAEIDEIAEKVAAQLAHLLRNARRSIYVVS